MAFSNGISISSGIFQGTFTGPLDFYWDLFGEVGREDDACGQPAVEQFPDHRKP